MNWGPFSRCYSRDTTMAAPRVARPEDVSFPHRLPPGKRDLVLAGSRHVRHSAGSVVYRPGDPFVGTLSTGMARSYIMSLDGRQVTVRYIRPGDLMGAMNVMHQPFPGSIQILVESSIEYLDIARLRRLVATDAEVAEALATELAIRSTQIEILALNTFGTVAQRLAYDLLERASRGQLESGRLEAEATHQELADDVGSVREVVARAMRDLREQGLVETSHGRVRLVQPMALMKLAMAAYDVAVVPSRISADKSSAKDR